MLLFSIDMYRLNSRLVAIGLLILSFLALYWRVLHKLVMDWANDGNYSHGFFIVPLSAFFVWERRQALAATPIRPSWVGFFVMVASIGVLLVAAFTAGRIWERPPAGSSARGVDEQSLNERLLRSEVEDHLERSQRMLVELVNADYQIGAPANGDQARAADLVAAGRLYRRSAEQLGDSEIGRLLEDLERVLVEVANGPADIAPEDLTRLRQRIDDQDLVFRVRVVAREIKERGW